VHLWWPNWPLLGTPPIEDWNASPYSRRSVPGGFKAAYSEKLVEAQKEQIDQSKNLGLTAAIARRSLPTIRGDQFGMSWPLLAGERWVVPGRPRSPHSKIQRAPKSRNAPRGFVSSMRKTTPFCAVQRDSEVPRCLQFTQTEVRI
jgi:hypothetical protein